MFKAAKNLVVNAVLNAAGVKQGVNEAISEQRRFAGETRRINRQMQADAAMASFGGSGMIGRQARYAATQIGGMAGGTAGMAVSSIASLSGPAAAISGAMILVGKAFAESAKHAEEYKEVSAKFQSHLDEARKFQMSLEPKFDIGSTGKSSESRVDQITEQIREAEKKYEGLTKKLSSFWGVMGMAMDSANPFKGDIDLNNAVAEAHKDLTLLRSELEKAKGVVNSETEKTLALLVEMGKDAVTDAKLAAMEMGADKDRAIFAEKIRRQTRDHQRDYDDGKGVIGHGALREVQRIQTDALEAKIARDEQEKIEKERAKIDKEFLDERKKLQFKLMSLDEQEIAHKEDMISRGYTGRQAEEITRLERIVRNTEKHQKEIDQARDEAKRLTDAVRTPDMLAEEFLQMLETRSDFMTADQEMRVLQKFLDDHMPKTQVGQFNDGDSRWRSIQESVLQKDDTPKLSLEVQKQIRDRMERIEREGVTVRAK
jgi:hypothetical protein